MEFTQRQIEDAKSIFNKDIYSLNIGEFRQLVKIHKLKDEWDDYVIANTELELIDSIS